MPTWYGKGRGNTPLPFIFTSVVFLLVGGEGEIRTHDPVARVPLFKSGAIDHSATSPWFVSIPGAYSIPMFRIAGTDNREILAYF